MFWVSSCVETVKFGAIMMLEPLTANAGCQQLSIGLTHSRVSVEHISGHQVTHEIIRLCAQNCFKEFR